MGRTNGRGLLDIAQQALKHGLAHEEDQKHHLHVQLDKGFAKHGGPEENVEWDLRQVGVRGAGSS
jgi:hypothetical protein